MTNSTANWSAGDIDTFGIAVEHPEIDAFELFLPSPIPLAEGRAQFREDECALVNKALDLRSKFAMPFWDALLLSTFDSERVPENILKAARFHNTRVDLRLEVPSSPAMEASLVEICDQHENATVVLSSRLTMKGNPSIKHVPMLDFHVPYGEGSTAIATAVLMELGIAGGWLLHSGDSYHFYGKDLLENRELIEFLGRALLYCPIVDRAWIAHQIIEGSCGLRISSRADMGGPPMVVKVIG
jgi:hypothetical protein